MTRRVYITGAAGTGVSSLGRALAQRLHTSHADVEESYWDDAAPLFTRKCAPEERLTQIRHHVGTGGWVISGALEGWGDALVQQAELIVFLTVPTPIRIDRIQRRERHTYGRRILPGGDLCEAYERLIAWAARYDDAEFEGRNMYRQEKWLAEQTTPVLRLGGTLPLLRLVNRVMAHKAITRSFA